MNNANECGLRTTDDTSVPLQSVRIDATVNGATSDVTVRQTYENTEKSAVEAVYVFPLTSSAAIHGFRARVGDRVIEGEIEERDKAFEIYDDAMAEGHGAMLLDQERPNVFTMSVGNLKPGQTVEIEIDYVSPLELEGDAIRLMLPQTVSPRYVPDDQPPEVGEPDGERVNPPRTDDAPYGLEIQIDIDLGGSIKAIESPSHTIRTEHDVDSDDGAHRARVTLSRDRVALDRDFVLLIEPAEPHRPIAHVAREDDGTRVVMVDFVPELPDRFDDGKEVHFVLDCSGSMMGDSINQAKRALKLCLRALDEGDRFNVIAFGSDFEQLWDAPRDYEQSTLEEAQDWMAQLGSMGGTEILRPLQAIVSQSPDPDKPRQVLLLTDGQVSNEDQVIALCEEHRDTTRVFSFGIGAGASEHLVRSTARNSGGAAEFIFPGERIEPKVLRMFARVGTPAVTVDIDWGELRVEQAPAQMPAIFDGEPLTVFGRVKAGGTASEATVSLRAEERSWSVDVDLERATDDGPLPVLWARQRIQDLEDGSAVLRHGSNQRRGRQKADSKAEKLHDTLVELGKRYGLLSSATSYVAVETRTDVEKTKTQAELRKVPVAITAGWGGHGSVLGAQPPQAAHAPSPRRPGHTLAGVAKPTAVFQRFVGVAGGERSRKAKKKSSPRVYYSMSEEVARGGLGGRGSGHGATPGVDASSERAEVLSAPAAPSGPSALKPEPHEAYSESDALYDLLMTQRADGSFPFSAALTAALLDTADAASKAADEHGKDVVATALILAVLQRSYEDRRDEWQGAARKAQRWLEQQDTDFDPEAVLGDVG